MAGLPDLVITVRSVILKTRAFCFPAMVNPLPFWSTAATMPWNGKGCAVEMGEPVEDGVAVGVVGAESERPFLGNVWATSGMQRARTSNAIGKGRGFINSSVRRRRTESGLDLTPWCVERNHPFSAAVLIHMYSKLSSI